MEGLLHHEMLKKEGFMWIEDARSTFEELKHKLISPPVLCMPDFSREFTLECDASKTGIGAMLLQGKHPIAFASKGLKGSTLALFT